MQISKFLWGMRGLIYKCFTNIGMPSYIGKPVFLRRISGLQLGKRVRIYPGMRLELESSTAALIVGNNTSIGQNFHAVSYKKPLKIGNNVTISGNVFISNCDHTYTELKRHIFDQPIIERESTIGDYCFIGYGAVILPGTILGKQCVVGANSVVRGHYPDYTVLAGAPAKIVKRYNPQNQMWEKSEDM